MKTILHVIESLVIGGAEKLLINNVESLTKYKNIIVTLKPQNSFGTVKNCQIITLDIKKNGLFRTVIQLKKLIRDCRVDILHSHLLKADFVSRLSLNSDVQYFYTVHSRTSDIFNKYISKYMREKLTYNRKYTPIFVSNDAKNDYLSKIKLKGESYVLSNYVENKFHNSKKYHRLFDGELLKIVMVGSFKKIKNHLFIINALKNIDGVLLTIYGEGSLKQQYDSVIAKLNISEKVVIKPNVNNIEEKLLEHDLFVMPSINEGHSLALLEALTLGIPVVVSDIPSFREMLAKESILFSLKNERDFLRVIDKIKKKEIDLSYYSKLSLFSASKYNDKNNYIKKLESIYKLS